MTEIMASIKPEWCELIASGKKTAEVRKSAPKETPFKVYIYETKGGKGIGKVIGEFVCNSVKIDTEVQHGIVDFVIEHCSCLSYNLITKYSSGKPLYYWHISNLKIYDKPKELSEFNLKRPPQSWCYIKREN